MDKALFEKALDAIARAKKATSVDAALRFAAEARDLVRQAREEATLEFVRARPLHDLVKH